MNVFGMCCVIWQIVMKAGRAFRIYFFTSFSVLRLADIPVTTHMESNYFNSFCKNCTVFCRESGYYVCHLDASKIKMKKKKHICFKSNSTATFRFVPQLSQYLLLLRRLKCTCLYFSNQHGPIRVIFRTLSYVYLVDAI